jgi:hypothetical protein
VDHCSGHICLRHNLSRSSSSRASRPDPSGAESGWASSAAASLSSPRVLMRRLQSNCSRVRTRVPRTVAAPRRGWERSRKSHRAGPVTDEATGIDRPQATQVNSALLVRACPRICVEEQHMGVDWGVIQLIRRHPVVTLFVRAYGCPGRYRYRARLESWKAVGGGRWSGPRP